MHALKISACGAMLILIAPVAAAHPVRNHHAHAGAMAMKCSSMHAQMHGAGGTKADQARPGSPMMQGGMKCMSRHQSEAPAAPADKPPSQPEHDHMGGQPPK